MAAGIPKLVTSPPIPTYTASISDPSHQKWAANRKDNSSTQNVARRQGSVTQLSRRTTAQHQYFPITHTVTQSTVGPSQQTHATHFIIPTVISPVFRKSATSSAVQQGDFKSSAQGSSSQNNSSIQNVVSEQSSGNPISLTTPFQHQDLQAAPAVAQGMRDSLLIVTFRNNCRFYPTNACTLCTTRTINGNISFSKQDCGVLSSCLQEMPLSHLVCCSARGFEYAKFSLLPISFAIVVR